MKTYAVIGLGKFGFHVAKGLTQQGLSVIAVDRNEEVLREIDEWLVPGPAPFFGWVHFMDVHWPNMPTK